MGATARPSRPSHDPGPLLVHARPRGSALLDAAGAVGDAKNLCILDRPHTEWVMLHGDALSEAAVRACARRMHRGHGCDRGGAAHARRRRDQPHERGRGAQALRASPRLLCAGRVPRGHRRSSRPRTRWIPNAKDLVFNLGVVHEKLGDIEDALKWFRLYTTMNLTRDRAGTGGRLRPAARGREEGAGGQAGRRRSSRRDDPSHPTPASAAEGRAPRTDRRPDHRRRERHGGGARLRAW